jgi:hypothetical protein
MSVMSPLSAGLGRTYRQTFGSAGTWLADTFVILAFLTIPTRLAVRTTCSRSAFLDAVAVQAFLPWLALHCISY